MEATRADTIDLDSSVELALALIAAQQRGEVECAERCPEGIHCPCELLDAAGWPGEEAA